MSVSEYAQSHPSFFVHRLSVSTISARYDQHLHSSPEPTSQGCRQSLTEIVAHTNKCRSSQANNRAKPRDSKHEKTRFLTLPKKVGSLKPLTAVDKMA
jgi:hypothetical protein